MKHYFTLVLVVVHGPSAIGIAFAELQWSKALPKARLGCGFGLGLQVWVCVLPLTMTVNLPLHDARAHRQGVLATVFS